jgi:hypothetical protein
MLSGCQAEPANRTTQTPRSVGPEAPAKPALGAVATLEGEWRVAGIDGQPLDQPIGLALSASKDEIWWAPRCAGFVRSYRIHGTSIRFAPDTSVRPDSSGNPPPVCTIAPPASVNAVLTALDAADAVVRTPANAIEISGGGHSLTLFSQ